MMSHLTESLVEERVMQLQEISRRRNELLREMYHLVQKRDKLGSLVTLEEQEESHDDGLQSFLDRFDLERHPEMGSISNLLEDEVALPETPPAYSPVGVPEPEPMAETADAANVISESPMSDPPASPTIRERQEEEEEEEEKEKEERDSPIPDVSKVEALMDVDLPPPVLPPEEPTVPEAKPDMTQNVRSPELPQVPETARQSPDFVEGELHPTQVAIPGKSPTPAPERLVTPPYIAPSRDSPMPQTSTGSVAATREPSLSRISLPPSQRVRSPSQRADFEPDGIKAEPLDDEDMGIMDSQPQVRSSSPEERTAVPFETVTPAQLMKEPSEDQIMTILGPTDPRSSPAPTDEHVSYPVIDYAIPLPTPGSPTSFSFNDGADQPMPVEYTRGPHQFPPDPPYPRPPLELLPLEFNWKKPSKKKNKGADKSDPKTHEWQPMGLNKWAAVLKANPVHTKLQRATKCLSTRDWSIGIAEMHLLRVFERVDKLKDSGQWSFRQPKKQRGVGGLMKTHWDYLMDEMRWMRTDFHEERIWKIALAYNLAHAVMEWHEAGSLEERVRRGIVVLWKPPPLEDTEMADGVEIEDIDGPFRDAQDVDEDGGDSRETVTPNDGYGSDDESEDELDKEPANDSLEPGQALQDALEQLEQEPLQGDGQDGVHFKPKLEEIEDLTALGDGSSGREENVMEVGVAKALETQADKPQEMQAPPKPVVPEAHPGLKASSKNPVLGPTGREGVKEKIKYDSIRDHILYSDTRKLFIDLDDLDLVKHMSALTTNDPPLPPPPHDLAQLFPDCGVYGMLDVAPPPTFGEDNRKKPDRRISKDDPDRRIDEAMYTKLTPTSKFMFEKPVLLGTLRPASNFKDGKWSQIEEAPVFVDIDIPPAKPVDDNPCVLFEGTATKTSTPSGHPVFMPPPPRDVRKRNAEQADSLSWTPADDALLKQAVERYPHNWNLIADAFNSSRVTISTDKRTAWECLERWRGKSSTAARGDAAEDNTSSVASTSASAHMTTRGLKRSATQSATTSANGAASSASQSEPRKRRRHAAIHDTIKRAAKRREQAQKSNPPRAKTTAVHDTHGQFTKLPKLTPAELSRMKTEKEASIVAQESLVRRRNDELARQHLLREQARTQTQTLPPNAQQPQTPQGQMLPPGATPNGIPRPQNGIAQVQPIRSSQVGISQQQRIAALANANARMSPPHLAHAGQIRVMAGQAPAPAPASGQGQVQAAGQVPHSNASAALTAAAPALSAAHLSPSFAARATSSSPGAPHRSPPLPAASPANANVPRPPSVPGQPVQGMQVNPLLQVQGLHYYMQSNRLTAEQIQALIAQQQQRSQQQYAHMHHQQQQPQNPPNGNFPHQ
ncbi:hypothetical protein BD310DRAFT_953748 [Dichomitus squalens]|uniref:Vacuolar import and degradation protein 21 n=1 Tax=Dichomitus squalens TaxID=114155 RepID=A0A4Q9QD75_9APHY|nr:hypothetical protein BD310DRAFT_953748 [Dichomitus squalens]